DDVGVLERRGEADLALEEVGAQHRRHVGREDLEHHPAAERGLLGEEDAAHAAAEQLALDGVLRAEGVLEAAAELVHQGRLALQPGPRTTWPGLAPVWAPS